jgi:hypothetical protein
MLIKNIYDAIMYLTWQQKSKDYRMAAHYLGKVRDIVSHGTKKVEIAIQIGKALHLSKACDIAAHAYEKVFRINGDDV